MQMDQSFSGEKCHSKAHPGVVMNKSRAEAL